jgi:lysophospholipase L1-like esterase
MQRLLTLSLILCFAYLSKAQVTPCLSSQSFTIVVLGSSTAAGSGPSHRDSAWVNRYRNHLQSINPANQVINLAVGGTSTYEIMPTHFIPPTGRPKSDSLHNISYAMKQNPDAIIINMPSNDASRGYPPSEQLYNFDSLVSFSTSMNVPIWICTTQPRNKLSATQTQWQIDVKDSILAKYGSYAIDFWNGIATPTGTLDSLFDSGDGIHLNDTGHYTLFHRVKNKQLLLSLYQHGGVTDYHLFELSAINAGKCGDSSLSWRALVTNLGANDSSHVPVYFETQSPHGALPIQLDTIIGGLPTCEIDTLFFSANAYLGGEYSFSAWITPPAIDTNHTNDSLWSQLSLLGHPPLEVFNDTACSDSLVVLEALTGTKDSLMWYADTSASQLLQYGSIFNPPPLDSTIQYFVRAVRGPLTNIDSLSTTKSTNVNWNGAMFDLVGHDTIILDSMAVKVSTLGKQIVEVYHKSGSYRGHEANAASWTLLTIDTVQVTNVQGMVNVTLNGSTLNMGDTMGIYVQLQNGASTLSYQRISSSVSRTNTQLEIITGSGISHNFSGTYYPRDWSGTLFYHYGINPLGQCHTSLVPVTGQMEEPAPDLGADTSLMLGEQLLLDAGGFATFSWSTGETSRTILLDANTMGLGTHTISVDVVSKFGCFGQDSIQIEVIPNTVIVEYEKNSIQVFPNPSNGQFSIHIPTWPDNASITIIDMLGKIWYVNDNWEDNNNDLVTLDLIGIPQGTYLLVMKHNSTRRVTQLTIQ